MAKRPVRYWKRGKTWYYCTREDALWKTTHARKRADAEDHVNKILGITPAPARNAKLSTLPLRVYAQDYFTPACPYCMQKQDDEHRPLGEYHIKTCRFYLTDRIFPDPIGSIPISEISHDDVVAFRHRMLHRDPEREHANATNKIVGVLKVVLRNALDRGHLTADPTARVRTIKEEPVRPGVLTQGELLQLFPLQGYGPWRDVRGFAAFLLAFEGGMRCGEVLGLRWKQIDFDRGVVVVDSAFKAGTDTIGPPKSGKPREYLLPTRSARALHDVRDGSIRTAEWDLVFCDDLGRRMGREWWRYRFNAAIAAAGIVAGDRHLVPRSLRHSAATRANKAGVAPSQIRAAMGWADEKMRDHYTHVDAEDLGQVKAFVDAFWTPPKQG